jgi:hypothetical protein
MANLQALLKINCVVSFLVACQKETEETQKALGHIPVALLATCQHFVI